MNQLIDTNILLRFLIGEPKAQADRAKNLFTAAARGETVLEVSPLVVAEACYTLGSFYEVDRASIVENMTALLSRKGVKVRDAAVVFDALARLKQFNVGFTDAFLAATAAAEKKPVASFDRDFDRFKDIRRVEPR